MKILGVNTESLALSIVAVVLSLLLAAALLARVWARIVLLAVAAFTLVFAAGDGRELVHQLDDSNAGLAVVAGLLIGLASTPRGKPDFKLTQQADRRRDAGQRRVALCGDR